MADDLAQATFSAKATESLAGAAADQAAERYNSCASRCYYACFQAAIAALIGAGTAPRGANGEWSHEFVRSEFEGVLIGRRKLYPGDRRDVLRTLFDRRIAADYRDSHVSRIRSERALRRASAFVAAIQVQERAG